MSKFRKIRNNSGKTPAHRAENIFPKYLLYHVHEIAQKYPREKKRYSSFSDSVGWQVVQLFHHVNTGRFFPGAIRRQKVQS